MSGPEGTNAKSLGLRDLRRMARAGERFSALTCYDATTARWLQRAGVHVLLVGDTAAEVILGFPSTNYAPLEFMLAITAAVKRGAPGCVVMGDMPFMSYQVSVEEALRNAGRFLTEGMADCVKLELDRTDAPLVERLARAGIPVVAHIGSRPQQSKLKGGYTSTGRTAESAMRVMHDAAALEAAGASMLLVEACPAEVTQMVVERATVPVIGCGAGPACHGQVVVLQDLLGLTEWQPGFAQPAAQLGQAVQAAAQQWCSRVQSGELGPHPYTMPPLELARLRQLAGDPA
ncbi:MAG: 3-methyl-2-oxobutanoate hydroxymethyltransferase [Phycisphaerales bacterium]